MRYVEQRIPTLNEYCVVCDERHVFQNGPMLKVWVITKKLLVIYCFITYLVVLKVFCLVFLACSLHQGAMCLFL